MDISEVEQRSRGMLGEHSPKIISAKFCLWFCILHNGCAIMYFPNGIVYECSNNECFTDKRRNWVGISDGIFC